MGTLDIGQLKRKRMADLKGFAPDEARFETDDPLVVIMDFDDLQIMPVFTRQATTSGMFPEYFQ
jgi:hypothetical protein